jgi:hypothetical protein
VVLDHDLLYGHGVMTLITFQDGKPVLRDGAVGTEQACCCGCDPCLVRLCAAYAICNDPNDTSSLEWACGINDNAYLWLKAALESVGWTVAISEWPIEEIPGGDNCPFGNGIYCRQKIVATCSLCELNGPNDGEWLNLEEYVIDNPLPDEPLPPSGIPQGQYIFVGSPPIDMYGSFPCDSNRGSGFTTLQGPCGDKPYFNTMIPICNPLP